MSFVKVSGIVVATVTPMTQAGAVDYAALDALNRYVVDGGVHGVFCCGSTGEGVLMTQAERQKVAEETVKSVGGRVPVIVHTGSVNQEEALALTRHAAAIGAAGAALIPPYYYGLDHAALFAYFAAAAAAAPGLPLYVYNIPMNVKNVIAPSLMLELAQKFPNIVGIKDSSMDFMNFIAFKEALPPDFCILMGNDAQIYACGAMGGSGAVAATASVCPAEVAAIWNALAKGDHAEALARQKVIIKLRALLRSFPPVVSYKAALRLKGLPGGRVRLPLRELTPAEEARLKTELAGLGLL